MESDINIYYVYCISNNDDGKMYIGYTKRFEERMKKHCKADSVVGRAIRKPFNEKFNRNISRDAIFTLIKKF